MVTVESLTGLVGGGGAKAGGGMDIGSIGIALLIFVIAIVIIGMIGFAVFLSMKKKRLKYTIPLHKMIGNNVIRIGTYKAQDFKIGKAGDKLWYIPKLKKYISCATLQTAPNEYTHFEREDGEWINVSYPDIDVEMKQAKVKYIQTDMRSNRIAISNLLDQRFASKKSFWEKYGQMIAKVIFYMIVCICMVVIFWQWSDIVTQTSGILDKIIAYEDLKCPTSQGVVPAIAMIMFAPLRKLRGKKQ